MSTFFYIEVILTEQEDKIGMADFELLKILGTGGKMWHYYYTFFIENYDQSFSAREN